MSKEINNRIEYTVMCIGEFSERYSLSIHAAYSYLKKYGGIALMKDCYDAMHLQSIDDAVDDLAAVCLRNGGNIA